MTTALLPATTTRSAPTAGRVACRREAMQALDASVRLLLQDRLLDSTRGMGEPIIDLTVYDAVYASTPATGGHWTVAVRRPGLFGHHVDSYTVTLEFDEQQRPARYQICGRKDIVSDDATIEALDRALVRARAAGPCTTWAPNFVPGISL